LITAAFLLLLYTSLAAPAYARAHPHLGPLLAEYAGSWPVALASTLAMPGVMLALIPVPRQGPVGRMDVPVHFSRSTWNPFARGSSLSCRSRFPSTRVPYLHNRHGSGRDWTGVVGHPSPQAWHRILLHVCELGVMTGAYSFTCAKRSTEELLFGLQKREQSVSGVSAKHFGVRKLALMVGQ
jgi:hypothetical protein